MLGGRWLHRSCNYLQMPIYVRENSILGMGAFSDDVVYDYLDHTNFLLCGIQEGNTVSCDVYAAEGSDKITITATRTGNCITVQYPECNSQFFFRVAGTSISVEADPCGHTTIFLDQK